jgi:hypothetical protein
MGFPILAAAIRNSGLCQWRVAQLAGWSESRLSRIVRRGVASAAEREALSRLLSIDQVELFAPGPRVAINTDQASKSPAPTASAAGIL